MKIILVKDLELYGVRHLAGSEVDVEPEVYNKIMQHVVADRIAERTKLEEAVKELDIHEVIPSTKRGRK